MNAHEIIPKGGIFLDVGCGVGRTSRALMQRFEQGLGVDISPNMIAKAREYAASDRKRAQYIVGSGHNLDGIPDNSVDFIYCHIVLQHADRGVQASYIREFIRVARPSGLVAVQVATGWVLRDIRTVVRHCVPNGVKRVLKRLAGGVEPPIHIEMHTIDRRTIEEIAAATGVLIAASAHTNSTEHTCCGNIEFMEQDIALARASNGEAHSSYLSEFFFLTK